MNFDAVATELRLTFHLCLLVEVLTCAVAGGHLCLWSLVAVLTSWGGHLWGWSQGGRGGHLWEWSFAGVFGWSLAGFWRAYLTRDGF